MKKTWILLFSLYGCNAALAQQDTLRYHLKGVEVRATKFQDAGETVNSYKADTSYLSKITTLTLADRLQREAPLFVRSYGPGGLSTVTLRGSGAAHTAIRWNGLPLNSPMNGLYDFNLLPSFLLDRIELQCGGNGPLSGSGAVGGTLLLDSRAEFGTGWSAEVLSSGGSFGQLQTGLALITANGHLATKTKIYQQSAENDFVFIGPEGATRKQQHAAFLQRGFTHDLSLGTDKNRLDINVWHLENRRDIPPHMLASVSSQQQEDRSTRLAAAWSVVKNRVFGHLRGGINREWIRYRDPAAMIDEGSRANTLLAEAEAGYWVRARLSIITQVSAMQAEGRAEGYGGSRFQHQYSAGIKAVYSGKRLLLNLAIRKSLFDERWIPLLPSASLQWQLLQNWSIRADVAKVYRVPTLNDLYWMQGGNPTLKPESGWSSASSLQWEKHTSKGNIKLQTGFFYTRMEQLMLWTPNENGMYRAVNLHTTASRGIELSARLTRELGQATFTVNFIPTIVSSVILASGSDFAPAIGKQMIYTPRIVYKGDIGISYKRASLSCYHQYTGYRYTTPDHAFYLEPYHLTEIVAGYKVYPFKQEMTLSFTVRNLFDTDYQVIAWRAMPGRSYLAGLFFTFGK
jgi:vitamin B12 transporter